MAHNAEFFTHTNVNKNNRRNYGIEHAGNKSISGQPIKTVLHIRYIIYLFVQETYQNIAGTIKISSISLAH